MKDKIRIPWFHYFGNRALRIVLPIVLKFDIKGLEHVPKEGALIAATNHTSFLDSLVAVAYLRHDVLPIAKVELFNFPWGLIFHGYGAFPVRRGEADLSALRRALQVLKENHVLLIAPEGTRTKSGVMESAREGVALLAERSGAPILPLAVWGGKEFWHNLMRLRRTPFGFRIGEPVAVIALPDKPDRQVLRAITDEVMVYIAGMLPSQYRGRYANAESIVPRYVKPARDIATKTGAPKAKEVMPMS
ncbi:MAG: lysophospholipid acyltransferase family protein [Rudaea sp.]